MERIPFTVDLTGEGVTLTVAQIAAWTISSTTLHVITIHAISDFQWAGEWMMTDKINFV